MSTEKSSKASISLPQNSVSPTIKAVSSLNIPTFSSEQLFGAAKEIGIEHQNLHYRLRITKQGKLILNK
ncbi:MAG: hemin uptake protein HemP [Pseudomonadota bacterium]